MCCFATASSDNPPSPPHFFLSWSQIWVKLMKFIQTHHKMQRRSLLGLPVSWSPLCNIHFGKPPSVPKNIRSSVLVNSRSVWCQKAGGIWELSFVSVGLETDSLSNNPSKLHWTEVDDWSMSQRCCLYGWVLHLVVWFSLKIIIIIKLKKTLPLFSGLCCLCLCLLVWCFCPSTSPSLHSLFGHLPRRNGRQTDWRPATPGPL